MFRTPVLLKLLSLPLKLIDFKLKTFDVGLSSTPGSAGIDFDPTLDSLLKKVWTLPAP